MSEKNKAVAGYIRVSTREQKNEGLSLLAQRKSIEDYAKFKGWEIYKTYEDAGISAKNIKDRPAFLECLSEAKSHKFSAILITKYDRLFRNTLDALTTLKSLQEIGVDFVSLTEQVDTTTPQGKMFFTMISSFAQFERDMVVARVLEVNTYKFEEGINIGDCPFGYKWDKRLRMMVINPKEAEVVRKAFDLTANGHKYSEICKALNLVKSTYYKIIKNPVYAGKIKFMKEVKQGKHEAIITQELFDKAQISLAT